MSGLERFIRGAHIPQNWQFTPEQMTEIIAAKYPGAQVSDVRLLDGSDGTSSRARLGLQYAQGSGPESVFAKTEGDIKHRLLHLLTGNLFREALMCGSGVPLPVEHPNPIHGSVDRLRRNQLVIMEDVSTRGVTLNDSEAAHC